MVHFLALTAALACVSTVMAIPAAVPTDVVQSEDAPPTIFLSKEDALAQAIARQADDTADSPQLETRQIPSYGRYCEHWDYQGQCVYHRFEIDNRGHYIGDDWNDRISSIEGFDYDKKCIYWSDWSWDNGGYCYGIGLIVAGRVSFPRLGSDDNDKISCRICSWN